MTVHFTKKDGAPVRYAADDSTPAAAIREIDLQNKYHRSPTELASALGLSGPRAVALRRHLGIDDDESCRHDFQFGSTAASPAIPTTPSPRCARRCATSTWTPYGKRTILRARRAHHAPFKDARQS